MKSYFFLVVIALINSSFLPKENPVYKIEFTGVDCYFKISINNKNIYKNENQYKVSRTLNINKFLEKKDTQQIEYFFYNRHTMMEMTEKSKLWLFVTKHVGNEIDTIYKSNLVKKGIEDESGKIRYPRRVAHSGYFLLN